MRALLITIFALLNLTLVFGQSWQPIDNESSLDTNIINIVKKIESGNMLVNSAIGFLGQKSQQYTNFENLLDIASEEDLIILTDHIDPKVRGYAFWALAKIGSDELENILIKHIDDNQTFHTMFGCVVDEENVSTFMIKVVTPNMVDECKKLTNRRIKSIIKMKNTP